ncbi:hypothetical protein LCM17_21135 [Cereibacter sphaeroides]|nr:hypothetical protein [Cereibacter sphaeroides]
MMRFSRPRLMLSTATAALLLPLGAPVAMAQQTEGTTPPAAAQSAAPMAGIAIEIGADMDPYNPGRVSVRVNGPVSEPASGFVRGCSGQVMAEASGVAFDVTDRRERLAFTAAGEGLVSMVLGTPDGLYRCALADERGLASSALAAVDPGRYTLWLGTEEGGNIDARVIASAEPVSPIELFGFEVDRLGEVRQGRHDFTATAETGRQTLVSGAPVLAAESLRVLGSDSCWGYGDLTSADAVLTLPEGAGAFSVFARSDRDLVMAVVDPSGAVRCNDDADGLNPAVSFDGGQAGDYQVFVGGYSQGPGSTYDLYASAGGNPMFSDVVVNLDADPRVGRVAFDASSGAQLVATAALSGGAEPMEALPVGSYCPGFTDVTAPDVVLSLAEGQPLLSIYARAQADMVMAVRAPDGSWSCNDDAFELNPGITLSDAQPGDYSVYLGTYAPGEAGQYNLYASAGQAMWDNTTPGGGFMAPESLNFMADPSVAQLTFGPETRLDPRIIFDIEASQTEAFGMGDGCAGFITPNQPDLVVDTTEGLPQLMVYMVSEADGTLVVVGPDGQMHCNDDFEQLNPGVMIPNPTPGRYAVFAGSYSGTGGLATLGVTMASPLWVMDREH